VNRGAIPMGIIAVLVGLGTGYMMLTQPEGLNPEWPLWMALVAPLVFVLGGLLLIAHGLELPGFSSVMMAAVVLCLLAIANWAAFFTNHIQCRITLSFLGIAVNRWYPSEAECRDSLRVIMAGVDILALMPLVAFARHKWATAQRGLAKQP